MRVTILCVALSFAAFAEEKTLAVVPLEPRAGALDAAQAAAIDREIRAAATDSLPGWQIAGAEAREGAAATIAGRATSMEGATVIGVALYRGGKVVKSARIFGIGLEQLRADVRGKLAPLFAELGGAPAAAPPPSKPGVLRMPTAPPPPEPATSDPTTLLVREVVADLESFRGLKRKKNLEVQILDDELFAQALKNKAKEELTPQVVAAERARWMAFDLAPASADPAQIMLGVLDEQVAGFYDPEAKTLFVRRDPPDSAQLGPDGLRLVLAHEIEHALQDQNFGFPDMKTLPDDDARLARLALYEGDAMVVMTAYGARRAHKPVRGAIGATAQAMKALDVDALLKMSGHSPALASAPAVVREELALPYLAGFTLVADAYGRGGFALVDKMFRSPPQSSHQVLHPEAYFGGEAGVAVAPPPAPAGTKTITTGRMGELGARLALEACVDKEVAREFTHQWSGDAYTVAVAPDRSLSLVWTSQWQGEAAEHIANVMKMEGPCWDEQAASGPGPAGWTISGESKMKVAGNRVALVRGVPRAAQDAALAAALAGKSAPQVAPALGVVPAMPQVEPPRVDAGIFRSPHLGLEAPVPQGYTATPGPEGAEVALAKKGLGTATLHFVPQQLTGEARDGFFQTAASQVGTAAGSRLTFAGRSAASLAGADAEERSWNLEGGGRVHILLAPFCAGRASLALVTVESAEAAQAAFEQFAKSLKSTGKAPACEELE